MALSHRFGRWHEHQHHQHNNENDTGHQGLPLGRQDVAGGIVSLSVCLSGPFWTINARMIGLLGVFVPEI